MGPVNCCHASQEVLLGRRQYTFKSKTLSSTTSTTQPKKLHQQKQHPTTTTSSSWHRLRATTVRAACTGSASRKPSPSLASFTSTPRRLHKTTTVTACCNNNNSRPSPAQLRTPLVQKQQVVGVAATTSSVGGRWRATSSLDSSKLENSEQYFIKLCCNCTNCAFK